MQFKLYIFQVLKNRSILLGDQKRRVFVLQYTFEPETWDTKWNILDLFHVADLYLKLLIVVILNFFFLLVKFLYRFLV